MLEQKTMEVQADDNPDMTANPETVELANRIEEILNSELIEICIFYEIIGKKTPLIFSAMDRASMKHFIKYVNTFH